MDSRIRVRVIFDGKAAERGLRGVSKLSKSASTSRRRDANETRRAVEREERAIAQAAKKSAAAAVRESDRAARERTRIAERAARELARAEARRARQRFAGVGRVAEHFAANTGSATFMNSLNAVVEQLNRVTVALEQQAGVQDIGQSTVSAQEFQRNLVRLGGEVFGDRSPEERRRELATVADEINHIALATNQEPGELLDALSNLQTEFSAFDFGRQNLRAMAAEAQRTGAEVEEIARFAGLVNQQFGEMDTARMLDITAQGGLQGAITPESLASNFAGGLGLYASFVDPNAAGTPEDRFRGFLATANVLRQSGLDDAQSANLLPQLFSSLSRSEVQRKIRRSSGVDIRDFRDESGTLDMPGFIEALQASGRFNDLETINRAVGDQGASQALNTLIGARTRNLADPENGVDLRELQGVSAESGAAFRSTNLLEVRQTAAERQRRVAIESMVDGQKEAETRGAMAEAAMWIAQAGRRRNPITSALIENSYVQQGFTALSGTRIGQSILTADGAREAHDGWGGLALMAASMPAWLADQALSVGAEARDRQASALPKTATNSQKPTVALDDATINRLGDRIGSVVQRGAADAPNPGNRQPGGPAVRR